MREFVDGNDVTYNRAFDEFRGFLTHQVRLVQLNEVRPFRC